MRTRALASVALGACLLSAFAPAALADGGDKRIRFGVLYSVSTDELKEPGETLEVDETFGPQASFEYMVTDLIGVEPALTWTSHDVNVEESTVPDFKLGEIDLFALTANLNFHVLRGERVQLYLGPTIGYAFWGDLETDLFAGNFPADDEFIYGLNAGIDVPFKNDRWTFSAALTCLRAEITLDGATSGPALGVDPVQLKAGASYRF